MCCAVATMTLVAAPAWQGSSNYTVYTAESRRNVSFKTDAGVDFLPLEPLTSMLKLSIVEDAVRGGVMIQGGGQSILLIPNQSFASLGQGRVVSLPGPVRREGRTWQVPAEFVSLVLAPALGLRAEIRRPSHVILIGDIRLPKIAGRVERSGLNARLVVDVAPPAPFHVTRDGNRMTVQFDAIAFEAASIAGTVPDLITGARIQGTAIVVTLGKSAMGYRVDETDRAHLVIEVAAPPPPPPVVAPAPPLAQAPPLPETPASPAQVRPADQPPTIDVAPAGSLRTIVIDPGHGGEDSGVRGAGGALEKTVALQLAKRLKAALESRLGLRAVLTREEDRVIGPDERARLANIGKGDLFLSLHANGSSQPTTAGIQVLSLAAASYLSGVSKSEVPDVPVPVLGGGTRTIALAPSRAAQIPFVEQSAAFAEILTRRLEAGKVRPRPVRQLPLRPLAGVHMPAVLIEAGFLSNRDDEKALTGGDRAQKLIDALVATIGDLRSGIPDQAPPSAPPAKP